MGLLYPGVGHFCLFVFKCFLIFAPSCTCLPPGQKCPFLEREGYLESKASVPRVLTAVE